MNHGVRQLTVALVSGLLFGGGLVLGGMTDPAKIVGFLDLTAWDSSLLFVMAGAVGVHAVVYRMVRRLPRPALAERFSLPTRRDLDLKLLVGSALFGIGWGLGGFCPGPGVASLASGHAGAWVFAGALLVGMVGAIGLERHWRAIATGGEPAKASRSAAGASAR